MKTYLIATLAMAASAVAQPQKAETPSPEPSRPQMRAEQPAAPKPSRGAFDAMLYVSVQDPSMEWWFNVPEGFAPHISELKKIFHNQEFSLFPFADNAKVKEGKFSISYSISMKSPDGSLTELVRGAKYEGTKVADDIMVACPDVIDFKLDGRFPEGLYKFSISAKDGISGEISEYEKHIRLAEWSAPVPFTGKKLVSDYVLTKHLEDGEEARKEAREFAEGVLSTVLDLFEGMPAQIREISMRNTSYVQATRAILEFRLNNFRDIEGALNRSLKLLRKVGEDEIETPFAPYQMATIAPESIYKPRNLQRRAPGEVPFEEGEIDEEAVLRAERFLREEKRYGKSAILAFLEAAMDQDSELASDLRQEGLDGFIKLSLTPSYAPEGYRIGAPTGERFPLGEFLLDDYLIERKGD